MIQSEMMKTVGSILLLVLFVGGLLILPGRLSAAQIRVQASSNPIALNESFILEFEASQSPDAEPDFSPLTVDFQLLNRSQSQNIQMINGTISRVIKWTLTMMPRRVGRFALPKIAFGADYSNAITLEVTEAAARAAPAGREQDLFVELEAVPKTTYPQAQVVLRVRLYRTVNIADASLSTPEVDDPDALLRPLGESRSFQLQREGRRYQVVERRYLLTPQRSGKLTVSPVQFQGRVPDADPRRRSFGLAPFGGFNQAGKVRRLYSKPVTLDVRPLPTGHSLDGWLPANGLTLSDDWEGAVPVFTVGEPVTRTLAVMADGLAAVQLPQLAAALPDGLKAYPDQPVLQDHERADGITGLRQEKIAIILTRAGRFTLPAIEVAWWDVRRQRLERARLPERVIQVQPAPDKGLITTVDVPPPTRLAPPPPQLPAQTPPGGGLPVWLALLLGGGWLVTALGWWSSHRSRHTVAVSPSDAPGASPGDGALKRGCQSADPAVAASSVLGWAQRTWPEAGLRSLGAVARRLSGTEAATRIRRLEAVLYAPGEADRWDGTGLWALLQDALATERDRPQETVIARLYPE